MNSPHKEQFAAAEMRALHQQRRLRALATVPLVISMGLACKIYPGPGANLINNFGPASVAYVVLLMLLMFIVTPYRIRCQQIAFTAFCFTCVVEFLQLWQPDWLTSIRGTLPGRLMLGTTFSVLDFPAYLVGALVGFVILKRLSRPAEEGFQSDVS